MSADPILDFVKTKLESHSTLSDEDRAALSALPYTQRTVQPSGYLIREGQLAKPNCLFVLKGLAYRQKLTVEGARQIVSVHMPGDFLDLQHLFLDIADHNVQALSVLQVAELDRKTLQDLILTHPGIGRAMWIDGLIDSSIYREWVLNVGRRDARARIAHILCEFAVRMRAAGLAEDGGYHLPMTQEQLGDAVGLTSVHVNRTLRTLAAEGLVKFDRRNLSILDWDRIQTVGEFSSLYLHLDQSNQLARG